MFELHPRLSQDCIQLGRFPLCRLLLMNESRFPWFILVPERKNVCEIYQVTEVMKCRAGCGACCIAISISSPIPGMPEGKPAGVRCVHLTDDFRCAIWGHPDRPVCCAGLRPAPEMCGTNRDEAQIYLRWLEKATSP
ncbi:putative Fe-S oxidoreductase [Methylocaldum marinum]|uniref:Putative Fe-S oxidoreductase n=1 Tax=Methylocaldum marinum TaxID=1432792 RepID=A0A250L1G6_9GAMM|nr:YkgJ family cysteine cluster protein [Methylocaldum marinum]BBA37251.1 putative Fe-S oxidoreductase [Methylocaldum marinum]